MPTFDLLSMLATAIAMVLFGGAFWLSSRDLREPFPALVAGCLLITAGLMLADIFFYADRINAITVERYMFWRKVVGRWGFLFAAIHVQCTILWISLKGTH